MSSIMVNFAKLTVAKLFMVLFLLCFWVVAASAKEPYADVFAFIQKMQTMHPLTIEKLLNEGFVITSQEVVGSHLNTMGTGPELADGTKLQSVDFRVSFENPLRTFLIIDIANLCISQEEVKKRYPNNKTVIYPFQDDLRVSYRVKEKEARLGFFSWRTNQTAWKGSTLKLTNKETSNTELWSCITLKSLWVRVCVYAWVEV